MVAFMGRSKWSVKAGLRKGPSDAERLSLDQMLRVLCVSPDRQRPVPIGVDRGSLAVEKPAVIEALSRASFSMAAESRTRRVPFIG
jgi:hypothetical protein